MCMHKAQRTERNVPLRRRGGLNAEGLDMNVIMKPTTTLSPL